MHKPELEFFPADDRPWVAVPGAPPGHYEKVLTQSPERMFVTRLMKVDPGCASVETFVHDPDPTLPSVFPVWKGADWMEREVYDMFGIRFEGHPDLKRILLPDGWKGHPLRKDYGFLQQDQEWVQINLGIESGQ